MRGTPAEIRAHERATLEVHACEMHACERHAYEMNAYETHAHEMRTPYEMCTSCEMCTLCEIRPPMRCMYTSEMHAARDTCL